MRCLHLNKDYLIYILLHLCMNIVLLKINGISKWYALH